MWRAPTSGRSAELNGHVVLGLPGRRGLTLSNVFDLRTNVNGTDRDPNARIDSPVFSVTYNFTKGEINRKYRRTTAFKDF
jgi:hypothetical protein